MASRKRNYYALHLQAWKSRADIRELDTILKPAGTSMHFSWSFSLLSTYSHMWLSCPLSPVLPCSSQHDHQIKLHSALRSAHQCQCWQSLQIWFLQILPTEQLLKCSPYQVFQLRHKENVYSHFYVKFHTKLTLFCLFASQVTIDSPSLHTHTK